MFGPDSLVVLNTLVCLLTLAVSIKALLTKRDKAPEAVKIPQPLVTARAPVHVTTDQFSRLEGEVKELGDQLGALSRELTAKLEANNRAGEERAVQIHNRIGPLSDRLHEVVGQVGMLVQRLTPRAKA